MKKNKNVLISILLNIICVVIGIMLVIAKFDNRFISSFWIILVTSSLIATVLLDYSDMVRPISYFILSFFIFVWMRPIISIFFHKDVITTGTNITSYNIHKTTLFLGITMSFMVSLALMTKYYLGHLKTRFFSSNKKISLNKVIISIFIIIGSFFFGYFLYDSIGKIDIIKAHNYFSISEGILQTGYIFFRFGKMCLLVWIILGKRQERMLWASTILLIASIGYLVLGARGYAITYFFLWLIFFQKKYKIKITYFLIGGITLILLANKILEYRLGFTLYTSIFDTIINTLHSQGASIEPVFGSVNFRSELLETFPINELLKRGDFGNYIDAARGVKFEQGGFSTSFFAEVYFLGIPGIIFVVLMGVSVGILEHGNKIIASYKNNANYYNILLFMTCPNLIYFARSDIKDYIFKSLITYVLIAGLIYVAQYQNRTRQEHCNVK